jgi:hypothetical protein
VPALFSPYTKGSNRMPDQINTWTAALQTSVSDALTLVIAAIPQILGFLLVLGIGWLVASLTARAVTAVLGRARFNNWVHRAGIGEVFGGAGVEMDATQLVALTAKWFVGLIALVVAFDALGLPAVSDTLRQMLLWLPNIVVALLVLVLGGLGANAVYAIVRTSLIGAELGNANLLAAMARAAVWVLAIVFAVYQLGIASELVTTVFTTLIAGLALALGLAFGLGGREVAGEIVRDFYERVRTSERFRRDPLPRTQPKTALRREH